MTGLDAQLALWNFYNGVVKQQPLQQNPILPFQPARPQSQNSTNDAPLDLGKSSRKREAVVNLELSPNKLRKIDNEMVDEEEMNESNESDSDSDGESERHTLVKNSSQGDMSLPS